VNLHPGVSSLFVIVRQRFWIIGARNLIRRITHDCLSCFRQSHHTAKQEMADLRIILAHRTGYGNLSREGKPRSSSQIEDLNKRDDQANHEDCRIAQFRNCVSGRAGMFMLSYLGA